jgi:hypothetical protein
VASLNLQIRKTYSQMYQGTQNTMLDNVVVDPDRDEKKLNSITRDLYVTHRCQKDQEALLGCLRGTREFCVEEDIGYRVCLKESY